MVNNQLTTNSVLAALAKKHTEEEPDTASVRGDKGVEISMLTAQILGEMKSEKVLELLTAVRTGSDVELETVDFETLRAYREDGASGEELLAVASTLASYRVVIQEVEASLRQQRYEMPNCVARALHTPSPFENASVRIYRCVNEDDVTFAGPGGGGGGDSSVDTTPSRRTKKKGRGKGKGKGTAKAEPSGRSGLAPVGSGVRDYATHAMSTFAHACGSVPVSASDNLILRSLVIDSTGMYPHDYVPVEPPYRCTVAMIAFALLQSLKVRSSVGEPVYQAAYGSARATMAHRHFYADSREVRRIRGALKPNTEEIETFEVASDVLDAVYKFVTEPLEIDIMIFAVVVSYLKSGHHITAANLQNTVVKMLGAMSDSLVTDPSHVQKMMVFAGYYGSHCGSIRLMVSRAYDQAQGGALSFALSRRLYPVPPGAVSTVTAMIFLSALDRANFFRMINRQHEYISLVNTYRTWVTNMHLRSACSLYMYGRSMPEDQNMTAKMNSFLPYAHAIRDVMPHSSLAQSVALKRDAKAAADNDIIGVTITSAFGAAIGATATRSFRSVMEATNALRIGDLK